MCGINAVIAYEPTFCYAYLGILKLLNRGYCSVGICTIQSTSNTFLVHKYASDDKEMADVKILRHQYEHIGHISIAHSRWATTGKKSNENSHPHTSMDNKLSLTHNGIVENYMELKSMLISNGYTFKSETDTEVIVNLISYYYEQNNDTILAITLALEQLEGTFALVILSTETPNSMYVARRGSPVLIGFSTDNKFVQVSSEIYGFHNKVSKYIIVDNHDIITLTKGKDVISMMSTANKKYNGKKYSPLLEDQSCTPYKYWTMKEINEQPISCMRAMNMGGRIKNKNEVVLGGFDKHKLQLLECDNLILLGCGTSYNAGLMMSHIFKQISGFNTVQVMDGAEFNENDIPQQGKTCFMFLSQSGETKDLHLCIEMLKELRDNGKKLIMIGVVNVVDSLIARDVDCGAYLNCGREFAVASTKAFSSQIVVLSLIATWFAQYRNIYADERTNLITKMLRLQTDIVTVIDDNKEKCKNIAKYLADKNSIFLLGKDTFEAVAKEGSLKMKEIGYIHSESYSSSALKHGPYALLTDGFPVILLCPNDKYFIKNHMTFDELKSRGAYVIGISDKELHGFDQTIKVPANGHTEILFTVVLQLISYYMGIEKQINVDFPRSLAKCVSVS